ncbi:TPA: hypothetical protein DDZ86_03195 [Candidatus Dependentiae bacterium]|nr:MAG: hypothetical protein UW09_C0001G0009 [candidate division TM6 bacterium GW2011_GWF2_43_87]HBL98622.1 hypothetical protein [Candidatus Dependentiae bacterium]
MSRVKALLLTLTLLPIALVASNSTDDNLNNHKKQLQLFVGRTLNTFRNRHLPLFQPPKECWSVIASFLGTNDKLSLRLVCTGTRALFEGSEKETPAIELKNIEFHLPKGAVLDENLKKKITSFASSRCIKSVLSKYGQLDLPWLYLLGPHIKKIVSLDKINKSCGESKINHKEFQLLLDRSPLLTTLTLKKSTYEVDFGKINLKQQQKLTKISLCQIDLDKKGLQNIFSSCALKKLKLKLNNFLDFPCQELDWKKQDKLKTLFLGYKNIDGTYFQNALFHCSNLTNLNLSDCTCKEFATLNWQQQRNLKILCLKDCKLDTQALQKILDQCTGLIDLNLQNCKSVAFEELSWNNQCNLKNLNLSYTSITEPDLQNILDNCSQLTNLDISDCRKLAFTTIKWHKNLNLKNLDLSWTSITGPDLQNILDNYPQLTDLKFRGCHKLTFTTLNWKNQCNLKNLDLSYTSITEPELQIILNNCPQLTNLNLEYCSNLTFTTLNLKNLCNLKNLDLSDTSITEPELQNILDTCPTLTDLTFKNCDKLTINKLNWEKQRNLKALIMEGIAITERNFLMIPALCHNLCKLNLWGKDCTTKKEIRYLWSDVYNELIEEKFGPRLENAYYIDLSKTAITDEGLQYFLSTCKFLIMLDLNNCTKLTFNKLDWKKQNCLHFVFLNNTKITVKGLDALLHNCPALIGIDLSDCIELPEKIQQHYDEFDEIDELRERLKLLL